MVRKVSSMFFLWLIVWAAISCNQPGRANQTTDLAVEIQEQSEATAGNQEQRTMYNTQIRHGFDLKLITYFDTRSELSNHYAKKLASIHQQFGDSAVFYTIVFPRPEETATTIQEFMSRYQLFDLEFFTDSGYMMTDFTGATVTPQVFLLDSLSKPVYYGLFDDQFSDPGNPKKEVESDFLINAIQDYLQGKEIFIKNTEAVGLPIKGNSDPV